MTKKKRDFMALLAEKDRQEERLFRSNLRLRVLATKRNGSAPLTHRMRIPRHAL